MTTIAIETPSESTTQVKKGQYPIVAGALLLTVGVWGLWRDIGWIAQPFYAFAWWGYILIVDGIVALRRGSSLLTTRRHHVLPMLMWSVTFWYFFELLNLRYQNWYYVGVYKSVLLGFVFAVVCFATVLIGMFETYELLTSFKLFRRWKGKPGKLPVWVSYAVQCVGATMVTLSLVFSTYLAPLVWGSVSFLLDPWNYRRGARSVLKDFENRDYGLVARLLLAGFICGGYWEAMNFFAPQKWIYTVRGLENFKLFEMPLLGFLGFPALVLDGLAVYGMLSFWFLNNETWENPSDLHYQITRREGFPRSAFLWSIPVQLLFCGVVLIGVRHVNIASERLDLEDLPGLPPQALTTLQDLGIQRPIRLVRESSIPSRGEAIRTTLGMDENQFKGLLEEASLYSFKGIGAVHGWLLKQAGVGTVSDLAEQDPEILHRSIAQLADKESLRSPRLDMVRVWVLAARDQGIVLKS